MKNDLLTGSVWKRLLRFALPVLGANLLQAMYGTVDLLIVGLYASAGEVSAVSTGSMAMMTVTGIVVGLAMGTTVLLGQSIGRGDSRGAAAAIGSGMAIFAVLGVLLTAGIVLGAETVATVMNAPPEAYVQTADYLSICGYGAICIVMFNALSSIFRGIGDSRTPLLLVLISCMANIAGDLLLVGRFGMGAAGAAAATVAAQGLSVVSAALMVRRRGFGFVCEKRDFMPRAKLIRRTLAYGSPIAAQDALTNVSFMVITAILNTFGVVASAGVGVAEKIVGLIFIMPGAMMASVSAFSAQNIGAGQLDRARRGMFAGIAFSFAAGVLMFALTFTNGAWLAGFFSHEEAVVLAAADYLRSYSIDCLLVAFIFNMMGYLNGHGQTMFVAVQGIICTFLVRIPVAWLISRIPGVSLFQIGFATPLASLAGIILCTVYLMRFEKKLRAKAA